MPKFKRIIISYFSGEPGELMRKAGFTWKFSRPVPIADSVEFYCCERRKKGPLPDHFHSVGWSDDGAFSHFTEEQVKECKQWAAAPQQEVTQALAKGMERYGDAMQKLADSGD